MLRTAVLLLEREPQSTVLDAPAGACGALLRLAGRRLGQVFLLVSSPGRNPPRTAALSSTLAAPLPLGSPVTDLQAWKELLAEGRGGHPSLAQGGPALAPRPLRASGRFAALPSHGLC